LDLIVSSTEIGFVPQETEVTAKARRRQFTAEYKRKILVEADGCTKPGEIGALLRREGLYSSHRVEWRRSRDRGALAGLAGKKRGVPPENSICAKALEPRRVARIAFGGC
jgi:hypothetical protein